ncbi:28S ribosomal protein S10, mitochondrial [Microplitis mediator]|uniref:28S ribosomal protein S10, mitochondrial n=1 Tax=Microplitis mediator TaxID=375433 RepID=UPI0025551E05|nr:28S ribosomal protein S10, mitochondrial [Microplitis mediator]
MFLVKNIFQPQNVSGLQTRTLVQQMSCQRFLSALATNEAPRHDKLFKKIEVEVRGNEPAVLRSYGIFVSTAATHLGINMSKNSQPKRPIHERYTILKSAFVHKKHRVQYEHRTYYRYMNFDRLTESTADTFLEYIQRNLPEGVAMKVTKTEIQPVLESVREPLIQSTAATKKPAELTEKLS